MLDGDSQTQEWECTISSLFFRSHKVFLTERSSHNFQNCRQTPSFIYSDKFVCSTLGLGLARCHGRTICRQIKFNQSHLRTQICCSCVHEHACWRHSIENSMAREFACSGGANQLSNFCNELRSKLCNFKLVVSLSFRCNMQQHAKIVVCHDNVAE